MAGPKEEWLIWDRRFQFGYSCLNQRLKINEEATQQIAQLKQKTEDLAASSKILHEANESLRDRIQKLEQASSQIIQLDEQIQDLAASSRSLKEENNVINDRMLQLEQEGTRRDEGNRLAQEQLKEQLSVQEEDFKSVVATVKAMNVITRAERDERGEEIQHLRSQVEALFATRHAPAGYARDASRRISQATTEDECMPVNQQAKQQPNAFHQNIQVQGMLIKAQAPFTLFEDHLRYADKAFKRYEAEAVQAFVSSVQEEYRIPLCKKLEQHGEWTWQAAREEGYRIVDNEKKTKRRSARLIAASPQPS